MVSSSAPGPRVSGTVSPSKRSEPPIEATSAVRSRLVSARIATPRASGKGEVMAWPTTWGELMRIHSS